MFIGENSTVDVKIDAQYYIDTLYKRELSNSDAIKIRRDGIIRNHICRFV